MLGPKDLIRVFNLINLETKRDRRTPVNHEIYAGSNPAENEITYI